jgi:dolichol-phosphate mannosyltransferase
MTTGIFGNTEFGIRLVPFLCWFITAYYIFKLCSKIAGRSAGLKGLLLISVLPGFFCSAFLATPDAPLVAFWSMTLYYLYNALIKNENKAWYFAGIGLGLGLLSKYTIILLVPSAFVFIIINPQYRKILLEPQPYAAVFIACLVFSPVIIWNASNDWSSFVFQGPRRFTSSFNFSLPELAGAVLLIITPGGMIAFFKTFLLKKYKKIFKKKSDTGNNSFKFLITFIFVPLSVFVFFSFFRQTKLNWTLPLWLAFIPFMSVLLLSYSKKNKFYLKKAWPATLFSLPLLMGFILYYAVIGVPGIPYFDDNPFLLGWENIAEKLEVFQTAGKTENTKKWVVAGLDKYKLASALSFYTHDKSKNKTDYTITGRNLIGKNGLMYNFWTDKNKFAGKNVILITEDKKDFVSNDLSTYFKSFGEIKEVSISKNDKEVKKYYGRVGYGYTPTFSKNNLKNKYTETREISENITKKNRDLSIKKLMLFYYLIKDQRII